MRIQTEAVLEGIGAAGAEDRAGDREAVTRPPGVVAGRGEEVDIPDRGHRAVLGLLAKGVGDHKPDGISSFAKEGTGEPGEERAVGDGLGGGMKPGPVGRISAHAIFQVIGGEVRAGGGALDIQPAGEDLAGQTQAGEWKGGRDADGLAGMEAAGADVLVGRDFLDGVAEDVGDFEVGELRMARPDESRDAGHVGRRHRRAAEEVVTGVRGGREHGLAGGGHVDESAVVREHRTRPLGVEGGDGDRGFEGGGEGGDVGALIPGGGDDEEAGVPGFGDGVMEGAAAIGLSPTGVEDAGAIVDGVPDGFDDAGHGGFALVVEGLDGHEGDLPANPGDADAVVADGADDAGDMGAVGVVVHRIAVLADEVVAVDVIDVAVAIVIEAVARDLAGVDPDVGFQVGGGNSRCRCQ
ncbi:MAG: hypothetical protein M5U12_36605 [Verrucomicrobia bacterium]|nr:hypothetical protein [Verrucomicrobiota bacterium]